MNRRKGFSLLIGLGSLSALVVAIAAGIAQDFSIAIAAASLGVGIALCGLSRLVAHLRSANYRVDELESKVDELTKHVEEESEARNDLESKLASRIQLTAVRRSSNGDALTDNATGLFSEAYFAVALDARIAVARRQLEPVSVVLIEVIQGLESGLPQPADPKVITESILATIRDADTPCRLLDGGYAIVLEDTAENGAIWTVERIRRRITSDSNDLTMWAGVACYPAHGFTSDEILDQADQALDLAREWRQDRIEVAISR